MNKQELIKKIADECEEIPGCIPYIINAIDAEGWLYDPDQVPGRTITWSERAEILDRATIGFRFGWDTGFSAAGGRVVPDPGPTNAEKLAKVLRNCGVLDHGDARGVLAAKLDRAGVKAPGGDE